MKKFISIMLCVCICLSSTAFCFASATQWDTTDQANLRYIYQSVTSGGSLYNLVNNIYTRVNTISNTLTDIKGYLYQNGHSIAYWVEAIDSWMQPIYSHLTDILTQSLNIEAVAGLLGSTEVVDGTTVRTPYLFYNSKSVANWLSDIYGLQNYDGNLQYFKNLGTIPRNQYLGYGNTNTPTFPLNSASIEGHIFSFLFALNNSLVNGLRDNWNQNTYMYTDYNVAQSALDWTDLDSNINFTPTSSTNGLYSWLSKIQAPVARLSYVLASDERIEAQEKAADNEQAVVDNFIDSSGSGAASNSDFSNISDLSSGFKNNISSDASVSGIWNIFNSDNFGWFSQETADQLDTTGSGNRILRSSGSYPTPLLDQQTEDILKYIGGDKK